MKKETHESSELPISASEMLASLNRKAAVMASERADLLSEQLALEEQHIFPIEPSLHPDPRRLAAEIMNGSSPKGLSAALPGERLFQIKLRREALAFGIELLQRESFCQGFVVAADVLQKVEPAAKKIIRRRALAVVELLSANHAWDSFVSETNIAAGSPVPLPCNVYSAAFVKPRQAEAMRLFLISAVKCGAITEKEIKNAN